MVMGGVDLETGDDLNGLNGLVAPEIVKGIRVLRTIAVGLAAAGALESDIALVEVSKCCPVAAATMPLL